MSIKNPKKHAGSVGLAEIPTAPAGNGDGATGTAAEAPAGSAPASAAALAGNGTAMPKPSRLPQSEKRGKMNRLWLPLGGALVVLVIFVTWFVFFRNAQAKNDMVTAKVEYRDLQLKVMERGTLEAIENHDIKCEVKPGSRGAPKIMWVVDNGAVVEKKDLLVDIDDSALVEMARDKKIALDTAYAAMITAQQALPVAKENLKKWDLGDFPQQREQMKGAVQNSEATYQQQKDRTSWVSRMVKKKYMTVSQEESERANEEGCRLDLEQKKTQLDVLQKYTNPTSHTTFQNAITTAEANFKATKEAYEQAKDQYDDLLNQIKQCKVYAPSSGIVVYSVPEQTRMGAGATQSIIAQGEPVQFGQKMMSIPDLDHMQVSVRVHEAFINYMDVKARIEEVTPKGPADKAGLKSGDVIVKLGHKGIKSKVKLIEALRGCDKVTVHVLRDGEELVMDVVLAKPAEPKGSALNRGIKVDPDELFGAHFQTGLPATVRVANLQGRVLKAHIKAVSAVAAQQDWLSPDVKVYQAYIEIDESLKDLNLKPGLSADCTIFTEQAASHVLAIPVQSVLPPKEKGGKSRCYVMTPKGPEERPLELGLHDEMYYEVKDGLKEGDEVELSPPALTGDKDKRNSAEEKRPGAKGSYSGNGRSGSGRGDDRK